MGSFSITHTAPDGSTDTYETNNYNTMSVDIDTTISPLPIAQTPDTETIIMKIDGNLTKINISWKVIEESSSPFSGTSGSMTALDQIGYFKTSFFPVTVDDSYSLTIGDGADSLTFEGSIQRLSFNVSRNSPVVWDATLSFLHGNVVAGYDEDLPSKPEYTSTSSISSGVVRFTGLKTEYLGNQSAMTHYKLEYRSTSGGGSWNVLSNVAHTVNTPSTVSFTIGSSGQFDVRVACVTADGTGEFSNVSRVTVV